MIGVGYPELLAFVREILGMDEEAQNGQQTEEKKPVGICQRSSVPGGCRKKEIRHGRIEEVQTGLGPTGPFKVKTDLRVFFRMGKKKSEC
jgi:hypothetical protein